MKRHNGPMTAQDLSEYSSEFVEPISTTYRDWTIYELPPNVQGIAALEMLNIMETFHLGKKTGIRLDESAACHDRGQEAGVCGFGQVHRRPEETEIAGHDTAFERVGGATGQVD